MSVKKSWRFRISRFFKATIQKKVYPTVSFSIIQIFCQLLVFKKTSLFKRQIQNFGGEAIVANMNLDIFRLPVYWVFSLWMVNLFPPLMLVNIYFKNTEWLIFDYLYVSSAHRVVGIYWDHTYSLKFCERFKHRLSRRCCVLAAGSHMWK